MIVFLTPKAFAGPDDPIQRFALRSWIETGARVIMFGAGAGYAEVAAEYGVEHDPDVITRPDGRPLVSDMFRRAQILASGAPFAYVNSDIYLTEPAGLSKAVRVLASFPGYLAVARRWELRLDAAEAQYLDAQMVTSALGRPGLRRGPDEAFDFFLYDGSRVVSPPPFAVGRVGWDNWMVYDARSRGLPVIDVSEQMNLVHLDVAAGWTEGKRAPQDAETLRNRRLAGWGQLLTLNNATHRTADSEVIVTRLVSPVTWLRSRVGVSPLARLLLRGGRALKLLSRRLSGRPVVEDRFASTFFSPPATVGDLSPDPTGAAGER